MTVLRIRRVFISSSNCTTFMLCQGFLGEKVITYNEDGLAKINESELPRTKESLILMLNGTNYCPMGAFHIELDNGKIYNVDYDVVQKKIEQGKIEWA